MPLIFNKQLEINKIIFEISNKYNLIPLNEIINEPIIAPDHVRMSKGERIGAEYDCEYRTLKKVLVG